MSVRLVGSLVLTASGALVQFLAGRRYKLAWQIGVANQLLWGTYAVITGQYGFLVGCVFYGGTYLRNWVRHERDRADEMARLS